MQFNRAHKQKKPTGSHISAKETNQNLKLAFAFSAVLVFAASAMAQQTILKGTVQKDFNVKPEASLINKYGEAANDPGVADALRKTQRKIEGKLNSDDLKTKSDAYEALQNGVWKPCADPMMALMNGFVPPNMSPEQAAIMAKCLPKMPKMPQQMSPEQMGGVPNPDWEMAGIPEPMSPYIPIPDSLAAANRQPNTRQLALIPKFPMSPEQWVGGPGRAPMMMGVPVMPYGTRTQATAEASQRQLEDYLRDRFGPGYPSPFQKDHNPLHQQVVAKTEDGKHIAENDHQSVVGVCDASGNEITSIQYDPWGNQTVLSGGTVMPDAGFKGMYPHQRSGLYLTPHRVYSPKLARWLTRDPLGERAGTNLYAYCNNNPISNWDPLGLDVYVVSSPAFNGVGTHPFAWSDNYTGTNSVNGITLEGAGRTGMSGSASYDKVGTGFPLGFNLDDPRFSNYPKNKVETNPDGTYGTNHLSENDFIDELNNDENGLNDGPYVPYFNDCHNGLKRAFNNTGVPYPGSPLPRVPGFKPSSEPARMGPGF